MRISNLINGFPCINLFETISAASDVSATNRAHLKNSIKLLLLLGHKFSALAAPPSNRQTRAKTVQINCFESSVNKNDQINPPRQCRRHGRKPQAASTLPDDDATRVVLIAAEGCFECQSIEAGEAVGKSFSTHIECQVPD